MMVYFDLMNRLSWCVSLILFIIITLILAWLSWRLVGKGRKTKRIIELL